MNDQLVAPVKIRFEMSAEIGKIVGALAKARKAFKPIIKAEINPFFKSKYADLAAVIDATKDGLSDNGLAVIQPPAYDRLTGTVEVLTLVAHESGEWIRAILDMPTNKPDAQGVGSAITYGRRYAYSAILNVASESDDDGNAAVSKDFKDARKEESEESFDQRTESQQCIAQFQVSAIVEACKKSGKTEEEVAAYLGLIGHKRIEHIFKNQFQEFLKWANGKAKGNGKQAAAAILKPADDERTRAMKKLWATASEYSILEADVKTAAYEKFSVDSMTLLNTTQINEMTQWIRDVAALQT